MQLVGMQAEVVTMTLYNFIWNLETLVMVIIKLLN
jgi:hypothetical protein